MDAHSLAYSRIGNPALDDQNRAVMRDSERNFCVAKEWSGRLDKTAEQSQIFRTARDLISVVDRRHLDSGGERQT